MNGLEQLSPNVQHCLNGKCETQCSNAGSCDKHAVDCTFTNSLVCPNSDRGTWKPPDHSLAGWPGKTISLVPLSLLWLCLKEHSCASLYSTTSGPYKLEIKCSNPAAILIQFVPAQVTMLMTPDPFISLHLLE